MRRRRRRQRDRLGLATAEAVTIAVTVGALGTAAFFVTPRLIQADQSDTDPTIVPREEAHQAQMLSLLEAMHRCRGVLAVHERAASPYLDVVLWGEDVHEAGVVNEDEVIVLSHSELLQTLTLHYCDVDPQVADPALPLAEAQQADFGVQWRLRGEVESKVIGTGISSMRFTPAFDGEQTAQTDAEESGYVLELTWAGEATDEVDQARAPVRLPRVRSR
jgi:hypothetical protein